MLDKYEYKLRAEEIIRLAGRKNYEAAARLAFDIRWEKVKNIQMLCTVSEIYEKIGKYDESKDVLLLAYNRTPNGKTIVYRLTELSIAMKDYDEAKDFYHEYIQLAPGDSNALLLKYKLYKGMGSSLETLIAILEEFKSIDYQEEWILELARLYHKAGDREKCVEICNEIDLWFSSGPSVIQALELKKMYEPLTPLQERKLLNREKEMPQEPIREERKSRARKAHKKTVADHDKEHTRELIQSFGNKTEAPVQGEEPSVEQPQQENPVAAAIIKMAREKRQEKEMKPNFSVLPKKDVVKSDTDQFSFELPEGVGDVGLLDLEKKEIVQEKNLEPEQEAFEHILPQKQIKPKTVQEPEIKPEEMPAETEQEQKPEETDEAPEDIVFMDETADEPEKTESAVEEDKPRGLFGKMISRLTMEDDEMDDDFNDDYIDDEPVKEDEMVTRGLTGQYEKVVIDDDDDESDPLNARLTGRFPPVVEESEDSYEYIYADEDENEEYESMDDEDDDDEEEDVVESKSNKRFRFFRNTMEDDEMSEDVEDEEEIQAGEEPVVPLSYAAKYDTLNLQKELAKSIQQLMDATEKETVDSTFENVKKLVEESHIPELSETMRFKAVRGSMLNSVARNQAKKLQEAKDIEDVISDRAANMPDEDKVLAADATVRQVESRPKPVAELAIKLKPSEEDERIPIEQLLTQEDDGQLTLFMPEEKHEEAQIEGQMNMEDVLKEWEKQELLSESDKEKRALEEARKNALEQTQGIMTEIMGLLKDVIPKIGSIKDGEQKMSDLAHSLEKVQKSLPQSQGIVEAAQDSRVAASAIEAACAEAVEELERMEKAGQEHLQNGAKESDFAGKDIQTDSRSVYPEEEQVPEEGENAGISEEEDMDTLLTEEEIARTTQIPYEEEIPMPSKSVLRDMEEDFGMPVNIFNNEQRALQEMFGEEVPVGEIPSIGEGAMAEVPVTEVPAEGVYADWEQDAYIEQDAEGEEVSEELMPELNLEEMMPEEEPVLPQKELSEEQKEILSYFLSIGGLSKVLPGIVGRLQRMPEHMIVTGTEGSGRTSVAMRIIKASQVDREDKVETIAKIGAALLNQKDISEILDRVNGGVLIIEKAGALKPATVYALEDALYSNRYYVQIILVDKPAAIKKLLTVTRSFLNDIQLYVNLPVYTNNELAEFARTYADVNGYVLDGMAVLALHSVIEIFQTDKHTANLEDVKNIMDEAMERADRRSSKLFGKLFGRKRSDSITLVESDFE